MRRVCFVNKYYTIFELVIENTSVRHEPTYHNGIYNVSSLVIYTCVKSCSVLLLRFITVHNNIEGQGRNTYRIRHLKKLGINSGCGNCTELLGIMMTILNTKRR